MNPPADDEEPGLLERAKRGDQTALRSLYDLHVGRVFSLAYRMCGDQQLAEDLVQETFVKAFRRLDGFRGDALFRTWLHRVARTVVLNGIRTAGRYRRREVPLELHPIGTQQHVAPAIDPDAILQERLAAALDTLPERARLTLVLHDMEGHTHEQIATILGVTLGTSKAQLSRARMLMRRQLRDVFEARSV